MSDGRTVLAVDLQSVDGPIAILEGARIILNVLLAGRGFGRARRRRGPIIARPVAAEGNVEDHLLILEELVNVAATGKHGGRLSPVGWIRRVAENVARRISATREEEDVDGLRGPLHGIYTSAVGVKSGAKAVGSDVVGGAALVGLLSWRVHIAAERSHV